MNAFNGQNGGGKWNRGGTKVGKNKKIIVTVPSHNDILQEIIATIRENNGWHTCLKCALLSTISFVYYFMLFEHHKSPTPESMLLGVKGRIEGLKYNNNFGGRGGGK